MNEIESKESKETPEPDLGAQWPEGSLPTVFSMSSKGRGPRDYWALAVFIGLLILFFVVGYFGLKSTNWNFVRSPVDTVSKWFQDLERDIKGQLEERVKTLLPQTQQAREARKYINRGYRLYRKKMYDKAISSYSKAIQIEPNNPEAYFWRGRAFTQAGKYDDAVADFKMAVRLRPSYAVAHDNLAWVHVRRNEYEEGIYHLSKSIELNPQNGWAYYTRARCYFKTEDEESALNDLKQACKLGYKDACEMYQKHQSSKKRGT